MVFRKIFRGKGKGQVRSKKHDGTRTADACCESSNSFIASCDVSSLGDSVYSDANGRASSRVRRGTAETVPTTKEESFHPQKKQRSQYSQNITTTTPKIIYMFQNASKEGSICFADDENRNESKLRTDEDSIERRRKIFEDDYDYDYDYDDDCLAWDTAVVVDEDRYRRNHPPSWMATSLSCLACV